MLGILKRLAKWLKFSVGGRSRGIRIGPRCQIGYHSELEGGNTLLAGTVFSGRLGYGSYLGENCRIEATVGRFCSIASEVATIPGRHPTSECVSTHPAFYSLKRQAGFTYARTQAFEEYAFADPDRRIGVVIGHDVLVSYGVRILQGVRIGDGAILAAGALVRTDVEPYAIYGGVPARKLGQRFDDATIQQLLAIRWWDRPLDWIRDQAPAFLDVPAFLAACREAQAPSHDPTAPEAP